MIRDLRHLRQRGICYGILERYLQNCVIAEKKEGRTMKHIMWTLGNAMRRGVIWLLIGGLLGMPLEAAPHQRSPHGDTPTQTVGCSFATFKDRTWVTGTGRITRILPDDLVPPCHQRFIVADGDGRTVLIVNNIDEWPRLEDVNVGDDVSFRGRVHRQRERGPCPLDASRQIGTSFGRVGQEDGFARAVLRTADTGGSVIRGRDNAFP